MRRVIFPGVFNGNPCRDAMLVHLPACARRDLSISGMKRFLLILAIESLSPVAMAQITISCSIPVDDEEVVEFLYKYVVYSRLGVARKLRLGEKGCFYTCSLYTDDHAKVSR
jgi:hypothetical protein